MIRKILIGLLLILSLISVGHSVEYLNSCGKNSGWNSSETYIINFTKIPSSYNNNYCFDMSAGEGNIIDTTIQGYNQTIENNAIKQNNGAYHFFQWGRDVDSSNQRMTIKDIKVDEISRFIRQKDSFLGGLNIRSGNNTFKNIEIGNAFAFIGIEGGQNDLNNNIFENIIVHNISEGFIRFSGSFQEFRNNKLEDIYFSGDRLYSRPQDMSNNIWNNLVTNINITSSLQTSTNTYNNSIITAYPVSDVDDDGDGDTGGNSTIIEPKVFLEFGGYNFFQDYEEGRGTGTFNFMNDHTKPYIFVSRNITMQSGSLATSQAGSYSTFPKNYDLNSGVNYLSPSLWSLSSTSGINCSILTPENERCVFYDSGANQDIIGNFRGAIRLLNDNLITRTEFYQDSNQSNVQMFSTPDVQRNNIKIFDNIFHKQDYGDTGSEEEIMFFYTTDLDVSFNEYISDSGSNSANVYQLMGVDSSTADSNKIYRNVFNSTGVTPAFQHDIFSTDCDTKFYHNYVGNDYEISGGNCGGLNTTGLISYETGGSLYYWEIGNYYENNSCTDSDNDGLCDSSYTSGAYTDNKPLSEYPFDPSAHLLTADYEVTEQDFSVNLTQPNDNQSFSLSSVSDTITFGFIHDSQYPELRCDYVIDGAVEDSVINPSANTEITTSLTSWSNKTYTYRVECYNDDVFQSSDEISFNVTISGDTTNGGGDDGGGDNGDSPDSIDLTGIFNPFSGSPSESVSEIKSFFTQFTNIYGYAMMIGFIFIFIGCFVLLFALIYTLGAMIKK